MPPFLNVLYNPITQTMQFRRASLNQLIVYRALNSQALLNQLNVFGHMELDDNGAFQVSHYKPTVLSYRSCDNTCSWTPSGELSVGKSSVEPTCIVSQNEICTDTQLNRLFDQIVTLVRATNGEVETAQQQDLIDKYGQIWADSLLLSSQATLAAGNVYAGVSTTFAPGVSATQQADWNRAKVAATGYVRSLLNLATTNSTLYGHLNDTSLLPTGSFTGNEFTGYVVDLIRASVAKAKPSFKTAINQGIQVIGEYVQRPVAIMSNSIFTKLVNEYRQQGEGQQLESAPIQREEVMVKLPNPAGGSVSQKMYVYSVDDILCVLDGAINAFDAYVTSTVHFIAITMTGNVHLSTTVGDTKSITGNEFPLTVQLSPLVKDGNKVFLESKQLVATLLGDTDYIVSAQRITTSA